VLKLNPVLNQIANKKLNKEELRKKVEQDFSLIPRLMEGLSSPKATVRYSCGNVLMDLSEKHPQKLYPYMDKFIKLLGSKYRILNWNAIFIIANLAQVDDKQKFDSIFDKYFSLLNNDYMVTVANVVINAGKIALAKPYLMGKITKELLKVEDIGITPHLTEECKRVIIEKTIQSFNQFFDKSEDAAKVEVYAFVKRQLGSSRDTLRKEAELFLDVWKSDELC
jgi:hypothetical protein